jgi:lysophospholipase L1-like esterase
VPSRAVVAAALTSACLLAVAAPVPALAPALAQESPPPVTTPTLAPPAGEAPVAEPAPPQHQRLWLAAPRRGGIGREVDLAVRRRGRAGRYVAKLCVAPPAIGWSCRRLVFRDGVRRLSPQFRLAAPGRWLFEVRNRRQRVRDATRVRPRGRLSVLVTGDSMAQLFDHHVADGLGGGAAVRSEAHVSTGLSKPSMLDWVANSRAQARRVRPDVTIVFIGANDGFPMPTPSGATAPCCDSSWVEEYARRAAQMMRAYRRGSAGRVYWLTLPAPRGGSFRAVFGPVNAAIRRAARRTRGVQVVPIDRIFTPGFVYRDTLLWGGRNVAVRQGDGVHLNDAGASIAAQKTIARMRANRIL